MNENPRLSRRTVLTAGLFAALGLFLMAVALLVLAATLRDLDWYVSHFGWGYAAMPLSLVLPVVAALAGAALVLTSLRRSNVVLRAVVIAIWLICAIAFVLLPLRD